MASGTACLDVGGGVSSARLASGDLISPRLVGLYGVPSARLDCAAARAAAVKGGLEELGVYPTHRRRRRWPPYPAVETGAAASSSSRCRRRVRSPTWGPCCSPRRRTSPSSPSSARNVWSVAEIRFAAPDLSLPGPGGSAGKWEWGRRRERRGEGRTAGQASLRPGSLGAGSAGRRPPPGPARGAGKCQVRRPVLEPCSLGPGSVPLLLVQTLYSQASRESSCRSCLIVVTGLQDWPASPPTTPM